jgi:hypothetical protein
MHWRPLITIGAMMSVVCTGVALRYLAPGRFMPPQFSNSPGGCGHPGRLPHHLLERRDLPQGRLRLAGPADVAHLSSEPVVSGPWTLPKDVSDALPLDRERFAVALLAGTQISQRPHRRCWIISEAPQSRRLYRVGDVVYSTAPQHCLNLDAATTRLLKTIELGTQVGSLTLRPRRRRARLPAERARRRDPDDRFHAEIDRIQFGDDAVGRSHRRYRQEGAHHDRDDPAPGLRDPAGGAVSPSIRAASPASKTASAPRCQATR